MHVAGNFTLLDTAGLPLELPHHRPPPGPLGFLLPHPGRARSHSRRCLLHPPSFSHMASWPIAHLLPPTAGFKTKVQGLLPVHKLSENQAALHTTAAMRGQEPVEFSVHVHRVARCTIITDLLQDLHKQAGIPVISEVGQATPDQHTHEVVTAC
jgi:hypothetical protein